MNSQKRTTVYKERLLKWALFEKSSSGKRETYRLQANRTVALPARQISRLGIACGSGIVLLLILFYVNPEWARGVEAQARTVFALGGRAMPTDITPNGPPFASDRLTLALSDVTAPPSDRTLNGYLIASDTATGLRCADLPVVNNAINHTCDFPGHTLIGRYDLLRLQQEMELLRTTHDNAIHDYLQKALVRATGTPGEVGYGMGLKGQARLLADHAGFAQNSAAAGNLTAAKRHTEHLLNLLYGTDDPRYGDQDNDGVTTNPGDGYGLLRYRQQLLATLQAAANHDAATANIITRVAEVAVALDNIGDGDGDANNSGWSDLLIEKGAALLTENESTTIQALADQMAGLADRIYRGEDLNDSGNVEPIANEGGAVTAWRHTQFAADLLTSAGSGYLRFSDSTAGAYNDTIDVKLPDLPTPEPGEQYWIYLLGMDGDYLVVGAVDGNGGMVEGSLTIPSRNLADGRLGAVVTVGQMVADDQLPPLALGYLCTVMDAADGTPDNVGYGVGLADQAKVLADHARFAQNAATAGNLVEAHRHAEHVLNILYGTDDPRYGDHDNDGLPTNPGDGYGLLNYRQQMVNILAQAAAAADATENIRTRVAQVQIALENIGNGESTTDNAWLTALIDRAEALLAATTVAEAQDAANQVAGFGSRVYAGEDLNDNGSVEPIANEGGALTAYRYTQHAADFYPQPVAVQPTPTTSVTPETSTTTPTPAAPTPTPEPGTPTATPGPGSDRFENDDQCSAARQITSDGLVQQHNFHQNGDNDWVYVDVTAGEQYLIEVNIPNDSPADVAMELYERCDGATVQAQDFSFSPAIRLDYTAPTTGPIYLKFANNNPATVGNNVTYELSVRALSTQAAPGLLIIVAGEIKNNDPVQPNIYHVTDAVRQLFIDKGATDDQIYYLAPDLSRAGVDASASKANLEAAITQWADEQAATAQSLTIYMMDHGGHDIFYLDKLRGEWLEPAQLDGWLNELEALRPTLKINVIYEACESGSFISGDQSISKPGRVVISSTDDVNLAWASNDGAIFSDHLLDSLARGESLYTSFRNAQIAAQIAHPNQRAWIDGDGDGNGTDDASQTVAAQRGFNFAGTFPDEIWPPFIAEVQEIQPDDEGRAVLRAQVRDDVDVDRVWAIIYPPSYQAPTEGEELVQEALPTMVLLDQGNDWYGARFDGFNENGTYRVVFYADDNQDANARPVAANVQVGGNTIYLPSINR